MDNPSSFKINPEIEDLFESRGVLAIILSWDGKILAINDTALHVHGWEKADVLGNNYATLCAKQHVIIPLAQNEAKIKSGTSVSIGDAVIVQHRDDQGKYQYQTRFFYKICPYRNENKVEGFLIIGEGLQNQVELAKGVVKIELPLKVKEPEKVTQFVSTYSMEELITVLSSLLDDEQMLFAVDEKRKIQYCNSAFAKQFKQDSPESVQGKTFTELSNEANIHVLHGRFQELLSGENNVTEKLQFTKANKDTVTFNLVLCLSSDKKPWVVGCMIVHKEALKAVPSLSVKLQTVDRGSYFKTTYQNKEEPAVVLPVIDSATIGEGNLLMDGMIFSEADFNSSDIRGMLNVIKNHYNINAFMRELDRMGFLDDVLTNPTSVFWKNLDLAYAGGNRRLVEVLEADSRDDVLGKDDFYFAKKNGWPYRIAEAWREFDNRVIHSRQVIPNIEEDMSEGGNLYRMLTLKAPLLGIRGGIKGLIGISKLMAKQLEVKV